MCVCVCVCALFIAGFFSWQNKAADMIKHEERLLSSCGSERQSSERETKRERETYRDRERGRERDREGDRLKTERQEKRER